MEKLNKNLWIAIIIIIASLYLTYSDNKRLDKKIDIITERMKENTAILEISKNRFEIKEKEILLEKRNRLNQEVWSETGCIRCHNIDKNQLPVYNRSVDEAIRIVRYGTPHTVNEGMPLYSKSNARNSTSITDTELKFRLQNLYIPEYMKLAKELPDDEAHKVNVPPPTNN